MWKRAHSEQKKEMEDYKWAQDNTVSSYWLPSIELNQQIYDVRLSSVIFLSVTARNIFHQQTPLPKKAFESIKMTSWCDSTQQFIRFSLLKQHGARVLRAESQSWRWQRRKLWHCFLRMQKEDGVNKRRASFSLQEQQFPATHSVENKRAAEQPAVFWNFVMIYDKKQSFALRRFFLFWNMSAGHCC